MNFTQKAIIDTFWTLLDEKPYDKITVKDIADHCQISRNTFYYHFHDIPELLETCIKADTDRIISTHEKLSVPFECMNDFVESCRQRKKAILHIYHSLAHSYFICELEKIAHHVVTRYVDIVTANQPIPQETRELILYFYRCLFVGIVLDWLESDMEYNPSRYFSQIDDVFHDTIRQRYLQLFGREEN